jgi:ligand-binding sensor domain-containing protein/signal transduction histidine kinase
MRNNILPFAAALGICLASLCAGISAENGAKFSVDHWTTREGLPQNSVIAMTQTHDGYLWLGTLDGLVRFDGVQFTVFDKENTPGLNDNAIVHLFEDSRSNLWVGTRSEGILLVKDGKVKNLGIGRGGREGRLMSACEDSKGTVWLYTADGQLCRYRNGNVDVWLIGVGSDRASVCRSMIAEPNGLLWVGIDFRAYGIDPKADLGPHDLPITQVLDIPGRLDFLLPSKRGGYWRLSGDHVQKWNGINPEKDFGIYPWTKPVFTACEDLDGNLIVGTLGDGLWWFDADGHVTRLSGLSHDYILSLTMDREGNLWVGTDGGGLNRVKRQPFNVLPGTEGLSVNSAAEDLSGGLWLNTKDWVRFWKDGVMKPYNKEAGLTNQNGQAIFVDSNQMVWAGFGAPGGQWTPGLLQLRNDRFEPATDYAATNSQEISAIFQDRAGKVWVGTQGGLACWDGHDWKIYSGRDGLPSESVQAIAEDAEGNLWVGTGNGLDELRDGHFITLHKKDGLPDEDVSSLYVDGENVLWIGTRGGGLGRYFHGKWTRYTKKEGLLSESIGYLLEDGQGNMWIGSPKGLMRVRKKELNDIAQNAAKRVACRAYGEADGLAAGECTIGFQPGACRGTDGRLWFPTIKGIVSVDPAQIQINTNPPPVVIESVTVGGESMVNDSETDSTNALRSQLPELITVPPGRERVAIQFTGLSLSSEKKTRFRYRMEGYEKGWTEVGGNIRSVPYTKLPPGHYTFHVLACNEDEVWNETGASLAFFVQPPFWRTWWFMSLMALLALGWVIGIVHYFSTQRLQRQLEGMRQQQALEKERARIARDIHDQLGASMTQVSLLGEMVESDKDDPNEVEAHARQISQTARDTSRVLDEIVWTVNPSNDTLEGLINYICKYAQEYFAVAELRYRLDVPSQLPATEISPEVRHNVFLAAKEAVTNVVRHAKATEVWLRLRLEPGRFILELQDNGRGPTGQEGKSTRNGLRNMHKRMEDIGGSFALNTAPEGGALVRLTVPINNR